MKIEEECEGRIYSVEFMQNYPMRMNCYGKTWALVTQCIIKQNNLIIGIGEVVKHKNEKADQKYARINSARKAFKQTRVWKEIRTKLWDKILKM